MLSVPADRHARLRRYVDRPILVGIRPEHFVPLPRATAGLSGSATCSVCGRITAVEPLGAESHVYVKIGGTT